MTEIKNSLNQPTLTPEEVKEMEVRINKMFVTAGCPNLEEILKHGTVKLNFFKPDDWNDAIATLTFIVPEDFKRLMKQKDKLYDNVEFSTRKVTIKGLKFETIMFKFYVKDLHINQCLEVDEERVNLIEKINKCLELSAKTKFEEEAQLAAQMAQNLLAKHGLKTEDLNLEGEVETCYSAIYDCGEGREWKVALANVLAKNYRCKQYSIGNSIAFFGFETDALVARKVFTKLFALGNKLAEKERVKYQKEHGHGRNVYNSFALGFVAGVEKVLNQNCVALQLITPPKVNEEFDEMLKGMKTVQSRIRGANLGAVYMSGEVEGSAAMRGGYLGNK
jgi:Protein of unknown function (DUF2786).